MSKTPVTTQPQPKDPAVLDDRAVFALIADPAPAPMGVFQMASLAAMFASGILLGVVELRAGAGGSLVAVKVACALLALSAVATFVSRLPARPTAQQNADFARGSALIRAVALERFGVAFSPDNNAVWLMRYGQRVEVDGVLREVKVIRVGNAIALVCGDHQLVRKVA